LGVGTLDLVAGKYYPFNLRWYEHGGGAMLKLFWRLDGAQPENWQIVPSSVFFQSVPASDPPTPQPMGEGPGLQVQSYISNHKGDQLAAIKTAPYVGKIDFNWGSGSVLDTGLKDQVLLDFSGYIKAPKGGKWTFRTQSDDGVWLKVKDKVIVRQWRLQGPAYKSSTSIQMEEGKYYPIHLRWFENGGGAMLRLFWKHENDDWSVVPAEVFFQTPDTAEAQQVEVEEAEVKLVETTVEKKITPEVDSLKEIHDKLTKLGRISNHDKEIVKRVSNRVQKAEDSLNDRLEQIKKHQKQLEVKLTKLSEGQVNLGKMGTLSEVHGDTGRADQLRNSKDNMACTQGVLSGHEQRLHSIENKLFSIKGSLTDVKLLLHNITMKSNNVQRSQLTTNPSLNQLTTNPSLNQLTTNPSLNQLTTNPSLNQLRC
jgi:hypothetical protein